MATTFTWKISNLSRETADGYVYEVHYTVDAVSDDQVYRCGAYGSIGLERPEGELIPFADLTEDLVVTWLKHQLTGEKVAEIEAALQAQLDEQRAPSKAQGLPWAVAA